MNPVVPQHPEILDGSHAPLHLVHDWKERVVGLGLIGLGVRDLTRGNFTRGTIEIAAGALPYIRDLLPHPEQ